MLKSYKSKILLGKCFLYIVSQTLWIGDLKWGKQFKLNLNLKKKNCLHVFCALFVDYWTFGNVLLLSAVI